MGIAFTRTFFKEVSLEVIFLEIVLFHRLNIKNK